MQISVCDRAGHEEGREAAHVVAEDEIAIHHVGRGDADDETVAVLDDHRLGVADTGRPGVDHPAVGTVEVLVHASEDGSESAQFLLGDLVLDFLLAELFRENLPHPIGIDLPRDVDGRIPQSVRSRVFEGKKGEDLGLGEEEGAEPHRLEGFLAADLVEADGVGSVEALAVGSTSDANGALGELAEEVGWEAMTASVCASRQQRGANSPLLATSGTLDPKERDPRALYLLIKSSSSAASSSWRCSILANSPSASS